MNIQMNAILLLWVLVNLFLETAGGAKCHGCIDVEFDNTCRTKPYECTIRRGRSCFIRRSQKNGEINKMTRGCILSCRTGLSVKYGHEIYTWCCSSDYCNSLNAWF